MSTNSNPYLLGTTGKAVTRLEIQAEIFDQQSYPFLKNWVKPDMHILEVGCGAGNTSVILAELLNHTGHLTSTDLSQNFVDITSAKIAEKKFSNVTVRQCAIEDAHQLNQQFDLIYGRAVLHQIIDASDAILLLSKLLKNGGMMLFEEPVMSDFFCYPENPAFAALIDLYVKLGEKTQHDFLIGKKLDALYKNAQLKTHHYGFVQSVLSEHQRVIMPMLAQECAHEFIQYQLIDAAGLAKLTEELETLVKTDTMMAYVKFGQIVGVRS